MLSWYQRRMFEWETRLTTRDTNRVVRPFDWGLDWTEGWPCVNGNRPQSPQLAESFFREVNRKLVACSDQFFAHETPADFRLEERPVKFHRGSTDLHVDPTDRGQGWFLRFTSPFRSPFPENNLANARWFPAKGRRAVIVLPQWNADALSHNALCRMFNMLGIAALRLSKPYHDVRMPAELERADYAVSSNIGRTIAAARQAIGDIRACLDWLEMQGYTRFGIVGTSLGSCYAFIASAHDRRLEVNAFNHASTYFADVVWTGQSTRHIRQGIESAITLESLRDCWLAVSPMAYFNHYARWKKKSLIVYATYDLTFLPEYSRRVVEEFRAHHLDHQVAVLPCGHYTTGETPYKFLDAWYLSKFLAGAF